MSKNTRRVLYQRQLMLFLGFSFVLVVLLSVLVITSFRSSSEDRIREAIGNSLDQVEYQSRFISERAIYVALSFYVSADTAGYLFESDASPLAALAAQNDMRERVAAHPFLAYAALYNRGTGLLSTSARSERVDSPERLLDALEHGDASARKVVTRTLEPNARGTSVEPVISYIYSEGIVGDSYETATIIDVPFRAQLEHVMSGQVGRHQASFLVAPGSGLVHPANQRDTAVLLEPIVTAERRGITEVPINNGSSLIGFTTDRTTGLVTVLLYDLRQLRETSLALQRRIALIAVAVLAAGWTLALVLTRYSYLPIQNLLDRVDPEHFYRNVKQRLDEMQYLSQHFSQITSRVSELQHESVERLSIFREVVLRSMLVGEPLPTGYQRAVDESEIFYCLLFSTFRTEPIPYGHEHIRTVTKGSFGSDTAIVFVDSRTTVVLVAEPDWNKRECMVAAETMLDSLNEHSGSQVFAFFSGQPATGAGLARAFVELTQLRNYQLFYSSSRLITPQVIERQHARLAPYDPEIEKQLLEMMRFGHAARYDATLRTLCNSLWECSYESVVSVLLQLSLAHGRAIDELHSNTSSETDALSLSHEAERWESFEDVIAFFSRLFKQFQTSREGAAGAPRTHALRRIETAIEFIRQNVGDPNLSVTLVASNASMSRSHFSRQFKENVGMGVNEFIARERVEVAQRLLTETEDTVESVARQCGLHNTKYFFRLFKGHVGVTPAAYRAWQGTRDGSIRSGG